MSLLSQEEIDLELSSRPGWSQQGDAIVKQFDRGDFNGSVQFLVAVAEVADEMNHHPDASVSWSKVTLTLSTHSAGGLTGFDFELAERIDEIA